MTPVRVIVCRVGQPPAVEYIVPEIAAMQTIVGGHVEVIRLENGLELRCHEDAPPDLPLTCVIPARAPAVPLDGFEFVIMARGNLARSGEPGEWRIRGAFFLTRSHPGGELADVTDDDIAGWMAFWPQIAVASSPRVHIDALLTAFHRLGASYVRMLLAPDRRLDVSIHVPSEHVLRSMLAAIGGPEPRRRDERMTADVGHDNPRISINISAPID